MTAISLTMATGPYDSTRALFDGSVGVEGAEVTMRTAARTLPEIFEAMMRKTIGEFGVYGQDSGVWAKGILADDFGFRPDANRWVVGGLDAPSPPFGFVPQIRPDGIEITDVPADRSLAQMLESGEIDALFTANVPQSLLDGTAKNIVRLFPDYEAAERDYYRRTGVK